jgi:hypothetical protein
MMGWMYMAVCMADFILFPILWSIIQVHGGGEVKMQWQPITLQGAGLFHIAMGAVLGIAAYGRTQEKMNGSNNGGLQLPSNVGTTYIPPSATTTANINVGHAPAAPTGYSTPSYSTPAYSAPRTAYTPSVGMSSTGKPMPAPQVDEPL